MFPKTKINKYTTLLSLHTYSSLDIVSQLLAGVVKGRRLHLLGRVRNAAVVDISGRRVNII